MADPIIEAVEAVLDLSVEDISSWEIERTALAIVAAVAPLIRAEALEQAAQVAENHYSSTWREGSSDMTLTQVAAAIRAAALEEAAKEAEDCVTGEDAAYNIRLLKKQP